MKEIKGRILFIDDDPDILLISTIRLRKSGYEVMEATDGAEGIRMAEENPPGIIFLDVMMPGKDGIQVCREIKKNPALKHIPVIFFTAIGENSIKRRIDESGADGYITKPFKSAELIETVERHLGGPDG